MDNRHWNYFGMIKFPEGKQQPVKIVGLLVWEGLENGRGPKYQLVESRDGFQLQHEDHHAVEFPTGTILFVNHDDDILEKVVNPPVHAPEAEFFDELEAYLKTELRKLTSQQAFADSKEWLKSVPFTFSVNDESWTGLALLAVNDTKNRRRILGVLVFRSTESEVLEGAGVSIHGNNETTIQSEVTFRLGPKPKLILPQGFIIAIDPDHEVILKERAKDFTCSAANSQEELGEYVARLIEKAKIPEN